MPLELSTVLVGTKILVEEDRKLEVLEIGTPVIVAPNTRFVPVRTSDGYDILWQDMLNGLVISRGRNTNDSRLGNMAVCVALREAMRMPWIEHKAQRHICVVHVLVDRKPLLVIFTHKNTEEPPKDRIMYLT